MQIQVQTQTGLIVKSIGGFYYVEAPDGIYPCKARGIFRKRHISPLVGDRVSIELDTVNNEGIITKIEERRNSLTRPPIANLDLIFIVCSVIEPQPNLAVIDKMIAISEYKDIEPVVIFTKADLSDCESLSAIYTNAGYKVIEVDNVAGKGANEVTELIGVKGRISAFSGNSGVGKSSLLNNILPMLGLQTNEISQKLGRGKHTTRHVELYKVNGGYCADTPGFSALDTERYELIHKDQLQYCFKEFKEYIGKCRFADCSHTKEIGCAVLDAVKQGEITSSRHESYLLMYEESASIKEWEHK
ncbi:MAG TPA: ribosome small subunit-dependent GTPase A [Oscillospiraceae bacterium]|nr:ribosome small subunit-dependent GTPase A [Oscillospiraceae bacterium]